MKQLVDSSFYVKLSAWYHLNFRDLPWRKTTNSYKIWVSEIIMQQTQVKQGLPYYLSFLSAFPTVYDLANAPEDDVLALWKGLGYYSRARNMHKTAKIVCSNYNGVFPTLYKELLQLPGIGTYSASAIASFSSNEAVGVLDGNVFRFYGRLFGVSTPINSTLGKKVFQQIVDSVLDRQNPALFNQAVMEFGALFCTPANPNCKQCPFLSQCVAFNSNLVGDLPVKTPSLKKKNRLLNYLYIKGTQGFVAVKRDHSNIWANLFQLPLVENGRNAVTASEWFNLLNLPFSDDLLSNYSIIQSVVVKHVLSHQNLSINFQMLEVDEHLVEIILANNPTYILLKYSELETKAFPVPIYRFLLAQISDF